MFLYLFKLLEGPLLFFIVSRLYNFWMTIKFQLGYYQWVYLSRTVNILPIVTHLRTRKTGSKAHSQLHCCCTTFLHLYRDLQGIKGFLRAFLGIYNTLSKVLQFNKAAFLNEISSARKSLTGLASFKDFI